MSHIHLPDGVLPLWLCVLGYLIVSIYLFFAGKNLKKNNDNKKLALTGIFAALMMIAMSVEIVPISYHINISALSGIVLGPILSPVAILVTNIFLAFMGHGGITVIGLNTIVMSVEAVIAFYIFNFLKNKINKSFLSVFLSVFIALFISCWLSIGIVYFGTGNLGETMYHHEHEKVGSIIQFEGKEHEEEEHHKHQETSFDFKKFLLIVLSFGFIGWSTESIITAFIVKYIQQIKPEMLEEKKEIKSNEF